MALHVSYCEACSAKRARHYSLRSDFGQCIHKTHHTLRPLSHQHHTAPRSRHYDLHDASCIAASAAAIACSALVMSSGEVCPSAPLSFACSTRNHQVSDLPNTENCTNTKKKKNNTHAQTTYQLSLESRFRLFDFLTQVGKHGGRLLESFALYHHHTRQQFSTSAFSY